MSALPLVSVIVPAYNAQKYLAQAIESVLLQSYPAVECIVVDDGSTDGTAAVARGFGDRVRYLYQDNAERSRARNNGAAQARGEWLSFLDADDFIHPEKIARQVAFLAAHPDCDLVWSRTTLVDEATGKERPYPIHAPGREFAQRLFAGNFLTVNSYLVRKSRFDEAGGFNERFSHAEDWELLLRLAAAGARFRAQGDFLAYYRHHDENTIADRLGMLEATRLIAAELRDTQRREIAALGIDPDAFLARHTAACGRELILEGDVVRGRELVEEACRYPLERKPLYRLLAALAGTLGSRCLRRLVELRRRFLRSV